MERNDVFELVLTSVFVALIFLMGLIPQLGYITLAPFVSVTLVHIPVLINIFIVKPKYSWLIALSFGLSSLIASYMYATNPVDLAFRNPLISVVPRVLFGFARSEERRVGNECRLWCWSDYWA